MFDSFCVVFHAFPEGEGIGFDECCGFAVLADKAGDEVLCVEFVEAVGCWRLDCLEEECSVSMFLLDSEGGVLEDAVGWLVEGCYVSCVVGCRVGGVHDFLEEVDVL